MTRGRRVALVASLAGLLVSLVPPWVEHRRVRGGHPFDWEFASRGYAFVGAPPARGYESLGVRPDWPKALLTWAALCLVVLCLDGTAHAFLRPRVSRASIAKHRIGIAIAGALLIPVPVPLGLLLVRILPSAGFVGSGFSGVAGGGPLVIVVLLVLIAVLACAIYGLLTLLLRLGARPTSQTARR